MCAFECVRKWLQISHMYIFIPWEIRSWTLVSTTYFIYILLHIRLNIGVALSFSFSRELTGHSIIVETRLALAFRHYTYISTYIQSSANTRIFAKPMALRWKFKVYMAMQWASVRLAKPIPMQIKAPQRTSTSFKTISRLSMCMNAATKNKAHSKHTTIDTSTNPHTYTSAVRQCIFQGNSYFYGCGWY